MLLSKVCGSLLMVLICGVQMNDAWFGSIRRWGVWTWGNSRRRHTIKVRPTWGGVRVGYTWRFSGHTVQENCDAIANAVTSREDWTATTPRSEVKMPGEADKVYLYHTGPDTCQWVKPEDGSCQDCLVDPDCVEKIVKRLQNEDLANGKNDIAYNYLIGQDGLVYEGRGWDVVGQHADDNGDSTSVGVAIIGDFSAVEPTQVSKDALNKLLSCGKAAGYLSDDYVITSDQTMAGNALYGMLVRCGGLCVDKRR